MFFWNTVAFFDDPADVGNLNSGSSAFSKTSWNIWKFTVHILLKPGLENFEHYFTSMWDECNCAVVWAFFGIAFLWDWNEKWPFPVLWPLEKFSKFVGILSAALSQHHLLGSETAPLEFHHLHWLCLYKKGLHNPENHDGVITHSNLEPDILECKFSWALGSFTVNKASGGIWPPGEQF